VPAVVALVESREVDLVAVMIEEGGGGAAAAAAEEEEEEMI
jgi:hypothetical protein